MSSSIPFPQIPKCWHFILGFFSLFRIHTPIYNIYISWTICEQVVLSNFGIYFLKTRTLSYTATVQLSKHQKQEINVDRVLTYSPYSNFTRYPTNVFHNKREDNFFGLGSNPESHLASSFHVSSVFFRLEQFFDLVFWDTVVFDDKSFIL